MDGTPDEAAADAVVRYYLSLRDYAYHTGDTSELVAISDPACIACRASIDDVAREWGAGYTEVGGGTSVTSSEATVVKPGIFFVVAATVTLAPYVVRDSGGNVVHSLGAPERSDLRFAVTHEPEWHVAEIDTSGDTHS